MNWRWIVPVLAVFVMAEIPMGIAAYGSNTWNLGHTEILTGWAAVREVCLVMVPLFTVPVVIGAGLIALAVIWALRGGR